MMGPKGESKQGEVDEGGSGGGGATEPGASPTTHQTKSARVKNVSLQEPKAEKPAEPKIYTTTHFCRLPVMYAVDHYGTPIGNDESKVTVNADGSFASAEQKRDHQLDELIEAIGTAAPKIAGIKESGSTSTNPYDFYPPLPPGAVILSITGLTEMR